MRSLQILYLILTSIIWEINAITTKQQSVRNSRHHHHHNIGPSPPTDWELGLREAVHQSFLREHYNDPNLHQHLLEAPIIGHQNIATPFGDIAIIARGQLYLTKHGYQFVQDPYQNDCDECHNQQQQQHRSVWKTPLNNQQLLALWTVKRIRHRDPKYGHIYELEYTISPINPIIHEKFLTRNGNFNYNLPGHVFVIKSDPRQYYQNYQQNHESITQQYDKINHFKPGIVINTTPDGYQHVLHSLPGFYSSYQPQSIYNNDQTTIDPKEYELYKKLIETLSGKTSQIPHRFGVTKTTTPTYQDNLPYIPAPETTSFLQFPDGNIYQITDNTIRTTTTTKPIKTIHYYATVDEELPSTVTQTTGATEKPTIATTLTTPTNIDDDFDLFPNIVPTKPMKIATITKEQTTPRFKQDKPTTTTKLRTTSHFRLPKTEQTTRTSDYNDNNLHSTIAMKIATITKTQTPRFKQEKPTTTEKIRTTTKLRTTSQFKLPKTEQTTRTSDYNDYNLYPTNNPTEPMKVMTQIPLIERYPNSINEQLPPPDDNFDTTIPYVSTVTVPTITKIEHSTTREENNIDTTIPYTSTITAATIPKSDQFTETTLFTKIPTTTIGETTIKLTTNDDFMKTTPFITSTTKEIKTTNLPTTTQYISTIFKEIETTKLPETTETKMIKIDLTPTTERTTETTTPEMIQIDLITTPEKTTPVTLPVTTTNPVTVPEKMSETTTIIPTTIPVTETLTMRSTTTPKYKRKFMRRTKKPIKISSTTPNDFLLDSASISNSQRDDDKNSEITNDDIFGELKNYETKPTKTTIKKVTKSDLEEALFGDRSVKQIKLTSKLKPRTTSLFTVPTPTPKIIYSNFYQPSTVPITQLETSTKSSITETATEFHPFTDQSYSTSISIQVNKKRFANKRKPTIIKSKSVDDEVDNSNKNIESQPVDSSEKLQVKDAFDNLALQLINHAKTIDYMSKKTSKQKNKRRNYPPKVQHNQRRLE